jgi:hypothetical protein
LQDREGCPSINPIHGLSRDGRVYGAVPEQVRAVIATWLAEHNELDGVVWTGLGARWTGDAVFGVDAAVTYLRGLEGDAARDAQEYIRKAPPQIQTPVRARVRSDLGWDDIPLGASVLAGDKASKTRKARAKKGTMMGEVRRNDALVFVAHTKKNLEYIEQGLARHDDVHPVTQLVNSLLGLVVFPWEKSVLDASKTKNLHALYTQGWPQFAMTVGAAKCTTLYTLVRRLRNATAHGNISFSSDSLDFAEVMIVVEDYGQDEDIPHWRAEFGADALRAFCFRLIEFIHGYLG